MSRKRRRNRSAYLNSESEAVQEHLAKMQQTSNKPPITPNGTASVSSGMYNAGTPTGSGTGANPQFKSAQQSAQAFAKFDCYHGGFTPLYQGENADKEVVTLYGANARGLNPYDSDMVIDLAGVASWVQTDQSFVKAPDRFKALNRYVKVAEVIRFDWKDYSIPPVGLRFWEELWKLLRGSVTVCCQGGHGRTGTCLAALMIADGVPAEIAIDIVRTKHCKEAIETNDQEVYLFILEDEFLRAHPEVEAEREKEKQAAQQQKGDE